MEETILQHKQLGGRGQENLYQDLDRPRQLLPVAPPATPATAMQVAAPPTAPLATPATAAQVAAPENKDAATNDILIQLLTGMNEKMNNVDTRIESLSGEMRELRDEVENVRISRSTTRSNTAKNSRVASPTELRQAILAITQPPLQPTSRPPLQSATEPPLQAAL